MSFWQQFLGNWRKPERHPAWATFFSHAQYRHFRRLIEGYFHGKHQPFAWGEGVITLRPDEPGNLQQLGLVNLAQLCARNDPREWAQIVSDHFQTLEKSQTEQKALQERLDDFDRVAELLAVRLWPEDYLGELDRTRMIYRRDLPGTISALVYDLPSSIRNVTPEEAQGWPADHDRLFQIALSNVRETCIPDVSQQELGEGVEVTLLSDESFFVASHALLLDEESPCLGTFGALVGVPHRHVMVAYPIESMRVVQAIPRMIAVVAGMEREGPGSISARLYWYQNGDYVDLPYEIKGDSLHFSPPEEFVEMLNLLGEADDAGSINDE